ncbi:hypothetical protein DCS_00098 [Drechmeria coniospora]|uniref:DUF6603 domain-containing protein n=1 Tax=Drechmeria coniospora TaxID=98403 RepID=A0A151GPI3_DRECN|nr:hypothetical protein DCS_00098 [Drechmeria coniospora]KYK58971.1 hypothetical protein DCS_00098 [Drechmeria coniospora]
MGTIGVTWPGSTAERSSQAVANEQQSSSLFYIYASSAGQSPGDNVHILSPDSATDKFVATLEGKVIILSGAPRPTSNLDDSDKTRQWFQQLDSHVEASLKTDSADVVQSFQLIFQEPWQLTFSSASDVLLFTFGAPLTGNGAKIPVPGIDVDGQMLTYGVDFLQSVEITDTTLRDLFTHADSAGMSEYVPSKLLDANVELKMPDPNDEPKRNALWFAPLPVKRVTVRLQFQMPSLGPLQDILNVLPGFTIKSADVVYRKEMLLARTESGEQADTRGDIVFSATCSVKGDAGPEVTMMAGVGFAPSSITLAFIFLSDDPIGGILIWLASLIGDSSLESFVKDILGKTENGVKVLGDPNLRRMTITLDTKDTNAKLSSVAFDVEITANFGQASSKPVFLISYSWNSFSGGTGTLSGQLWNDPSLPRDPDLLPFEERWTTLRPLTPSPATFIDLASLIPGQTVDNIPDTLPSQITRAYLALSSDSFSIRCSITANPPSPGSAPQPYLGEVALDASFHWGQSSQFALNVVVSAMIMPSKDSSTMPAALTGSLSYDSSKKSWELAASLTGLYASTLVEFFEDDAKDHVGPLIESIAVDTLAVAYTYESTGGKSKASTFTITGDLRIAGLALALDFKHNQDGFTFSAKLNPSNEQVKIGDLIVDALGSDIELPEFVYNTLLVADNQDAFALDLVKQKSKGSPPTESFQLLAQLNIIKLHIDFAQLHSTSWDAKQPSKRLLKVAIGGFSGVELELPLIGKLIQPLDELYFLWVQSQGAVGVAGLTRVDLDDLNASLGDKILVKDKIKVDQQKPTDLLVSVGCHFAIVIRSSTGERSCLLDYDFMKPAAGKGRADEADDGGPSAQAPYKKIAGPLSISNVGLKYKDKKLAVMFDATFQLGPLGFSLIGFSLGTAFVTLDELPTITPDIQGLAASFDKPPLSIAGVITHGNDGGIDYFAGGLIVGWAIYQFEAAGFYGIVTPSGGGGFQTVFVFAKLNGPLVTLGFAEITSVCGGFGYNSSVRLPTVGEVYDFPFIASSALSGSSNAMEVMQKLVDPGPHGWFQPLDKSYWFSVGIRVGAFQMLSIDAVVAVQFGNAVKLGIFAVASADIPSPRSPIKLAHVELGISAVADFDYGTLKIESQLSPRSYILDKNCHLTGGCGLYYWFDAPHADKSSVGQFVFTLGGYHQAYRLPIGFPNPPRLGIDWDLGGGLQISGQAYFAVTPNACMAGGRLRAAFKAGPIEAWFDAFADFLINYKPFHFNLGAGLSVGVGFSIDIWFIHIRISVEIGAQLYLWGPPVAGRVHVDFWIVAFDINFGPHSDTDDRISLSEFYDLVLQTSTTSLVGPADKEVQVSRPKNEAHNFLAESGLLNPTDEPEREQDAIWIVRGGSFCFVVECKMAIDTVKSNGQAVLADKEVYGKPMKLQTAMASTLEVQVTQDQGEADDGWQFEKRLESVPRALWAKYDPRTDPTSSGNNIGELLSSDNSSVTLMTGVRMTAPLPTVSPDPFPAYKVADADLQSLPAERPFPTIADADGAWGPDSPAAGEREKYEAVYNAWTNPAMGASGQTGFVGALAECLKWDVDGMKSLAAIPQTLKQEFMNLYVAAPLLTK